MRIRRERIIKEEDRIRCNECGSTCDRNWNFCTQCGNALHQENKPSCLNTVGEPQAEQN